MQLAPKTLNVIAEILLGNEPVEAQDWRSKRRTLGGITEFFRQFGERDIHGGSGAPSRLNYAKEKLEKFNGTEQMGKIICACLNDLWGEEGINPEHAAAHLNRTLKRDGFEVVREERHLFYSGNDSVTDPFFIVRAFGGRTVHVPSLVKLTEESITEQLAKARLKIESGDHSGAVTNAYTLIEAFFKAMLRRLEVPFNESEGDIRELYKLLVEPLNLNPKGENLESHLKGILQGLKTQVSALAEIAHKSGDRHAGPYRRLARHHAKLAVNAAFVLCEFILDSHEHQESLKRRKAGPAVVEPPSW